MIKYFQTPSFQSYECHKQYIYCNFGSIEIWKSDNDKDTWLCNLYVTKSQRGKGIGTILIQKAIELCKERNTKEIYLNCDYILKDWYAKFGFEIDNYREGLTLKLKL